MIEFDSTCLYEDGELYDALHMKFKHDFDFYKKLLVNKTQCLELGAGTGRLTIPLRDCGIYIEGLDISQNMLLTAYNKTKKIRDSIIWYNADVRSFSTSKSYDAIIFPANGFLHLKSYTDLDKFFSSVKRHLGRNGKLVIDIFNPDFRFLNITKSEAQQIAAIHLNEKEIFIFEQSIYDRSSQINTIFWDYRNSQGESLYKNHFSQRIYFHQEMIILFKHFGFRIDEVFGDHQFGSYCSESKNQIFILSEREC